LKSIARQAFEFFCISQYDTPRDFESEFYYILEIFWGGAWIKDFYFFYILITCQDFDMALSTTTLGFSSATEALQSSTITPTSVLASISSKVSSSTSSTGSCITVTPGKHGYVPEYACNANYNYSPNTAAAIVFAVIFGLITSVHISQAIVYKKKKLCWVIIMGALWELGSFSLRAAGSLQQQNTQVAFWSQVLVLLAPLWINAFCYMVLGRMIHFFIPEKKIWGVRAVKMAKIFVLLDVVSFLTQLGGGVLLDPGSSPKTIMLGIHIYMGGIGMQELYILIFTSFAIKFHSKMRHMQRESRLDIPGVSSSGLTSWKALIVGLYLCLTLITTRIIYRMIEFSSGLNPDKNQIPFHEAYFYALDALPMVGALVVMNICHPGRVLVGEGSEYPKGPTRKEKKAAKKQKKEDKRAEKELKKQEKIRVKFSNSSDMV
jgi:hypothetical protein